MLPISSKGWVESTYCTLSDIYTGAYNTLFNWYDLSPPFPPHDRRPLVRALLPTGMRPLHFFSPRLMVWLLIKHMCGARSLCPTRNMSSRIVLSSVLLPPAPKWSYVVIFPRASGLQIWLLRCIREALCQFYFPVSYALGTIRLLRWGVWTFEHFTVWAKWNVLYYIPKIV